MARKDGYRLRGAPDPCTKKGAAGRRRPEEGCLRRADYSATILTDFTPWRALGVLGSGPEGGGGGIFSGTPSADARGAGGGGGGDLLDPLAAGDDLAEGGVLAVEELGVAVADEELAAGRIRMLGTGHGDHAAGVRAVVELGLHLVARVAGAGDALGAGFGVRATALDHEALDHAVERGAVVETVGGELLEILDRLRGNLRPELDLDVSVVGADHGVFFGGGGRHGC